MNKNIEIRSDNERIRPKESEVNRLFGSNKKILSLTEWAPIYQGLNGFKKGLEISIEWFTDPKNLSLYKTEYVI